MGLLNIEFVSQVAPKYVRKGDRLIGSGSARRAVRPLEFDKLYIKFASLDASAEAFADFMSSFGPLTDDGELRGERIEDLITMQLRMRHMMELAATDIRQLFEFDWLSQGRKAAVARSWDEATNAVTGNNSRAQRRNTEPHLMPSTAAEMTGTLRPSVSDGHPTLCLKPDTLWDAMLIQFYNAISGGMQIKVCEWCSDWFTIKSGRGKREDAKFCSSACRLKAHRSQTKRGSSR